MGLDGVEITMSKHLGIFEKQTKSGTRYQVKWRRPDGTQAAKNFRTLREAKSFNNQVEHEKSRGTLADDRLAKVKFKDFAETEVFPYLQHSPTTVLRRNGIMKNYINPTIGEIPIARIRHPELNQLILQWTVKGLAPRTIRNHLNIIRPVFKQAMLHDIIAKDPMQLYNEMKDKKYKGIINIYTSIIFNFKSCEICICSDGGRLTRPLLRVNDGKAIITKEVIDKISKKELSWNDLLTSCTLPSSVIEYIDPEEQNYAMIAMKVKNAYLQDTNVKFRYTHCEIHPSTIFGVLASCTPFPEHNQAPRNTYQCAMGKQAIGVYAMNYDERMDKTSYVLTNPSRPLVDTRLMNFIQLNRIPSGCQIHVAIMTHTGYNQEDSVLVNKGSIDRGLFSATIYHTEKDEDKNIIRDEIIRCKPDPTKTKCIKFGNYNKINSQGFIPENTLVENRDIIIAKVIPIKENRNDHTKVIKYEDQSHAYSTSEETYIDKNYTGRNGDGYNFAKVRVRIFRKPVLGDKFSSRSGQKGTCGNIIPECDMPFTKDGLRPDIIINPHAIPSRMTIAQLKETLLGKVLLELGMFGDGTSFGNLDVQTITEELQKLNYEGYGNEILYNGLTGEQLETSIFIGPVFYQRLKHMVNDKVHSRATGPMVNLTHQPAEGRSRAGGLRVGEMERDVIISHGATRFCKERLFDVSDKYTVNVCKKCGMIASYNDGNNNNKFYTNSDFTIHLCKNCGNRTEFSLVDMPYANKLLFQELQTINVVPRIITE